MVEQDAVNVPVAGSIPALPAKAWVPQGEQTVIDCPDYCWTLEEFRRGEDQMVFMHLTINKWVPRVWRNLQHVWGLFRTCVTCPIWVVGSDGTDKFDHFVSRLGFQFHSNVVCKNGAERRLFVHLVDKNDAERSINYDQNK